jgi:hypothetical protein
VFHNCNFYCQKFIRHCKIAAEQSVEKVNEVKPYKESIQARETRNEMQIKVMNKDISLEERKPDPDGIWSHLCISF